MWNEAKRCFSFRYPEFLPKTKLEHYFEKLRDHAPWVALKGKGGKVSRKTCWWVSDEQCSCHYTYGKDVIMNPKDEKTTQTFIDTMKELWKELHFDKLGVSPNSVNLNLYEDGSQGCGWHADDESLFDGTNRDCRILSISLGGPREFWIAEKAAKDDDGGGQVKRDRIVETTLNAGDLITMEGLMQKHTWHFVPYANHRKEATAPRINLTFRDLVVHKKGCKLRTPPNVSAAQDYRKGDEDPALTGFADYTHAWTSAHPEGSEAVRETRWTVCAQCKDTAHLKGRRCIEMDAATFAAEVDDASPLHTASPLEKITGSTKKASASTAGTLGAGKQEEASPAKAADLPRPKASSKKGAGKKGRKKEADEMLKHEAERPRDAGSTTTPPAEEFPSLPLPDACGGENDSPKSGDSFPTLPIEPVAFLRSGKEQALALVGSATPTPSASTSAATPLAAAPGAQDSASPRKQFLCRMCCVAEDSRFLRMLSLDDFLDGRRPQCSFSIGANVGKDEYESPDAVSVYANLRADVTHTYDSAREQRRGWNAWTDAEWKAWHDREKRHKWKNDESDWSNWKTRNNEGGLGGDWQDSDSPAKAQEGSRNQGQQQGQGQHHRTGQGRSKWGEQDRGRGGAAYGGYRYTNDPYGDYTPPSRSHRSGHRSADVHWQPKAR
eukprot:g5287.t1